MRLLHLQMVRMIPFYPPDDDSEDDCWVLIPLPFAAGTYTTPRCRPDTRQRSPTYLVSGYEYSVNYEGVFQGVSANKLYSLKVDVPYCGKKEKSPKCVPPLSPPASRRSLNI